MWAAAGIQLLSRGQSPQLAQRTSAPRRRRRRRGPADRRLQDEAAGVEGDERHRGGVEATG